MKILVTTFTFFPNMDGVAIACASLCNVLLESGHKVHVATSRVAGTETTSLRKGVSIRRFAIYNSRLSESADREKAEYLRYLIKEDFDLIINQNWNSWTTELFLKASRKLRAKCILISHGLTPHIFQFHSRPFWGLGQWLEGLRWSFAFLPRMLQAHDAFVFLADHSDWARFLDVKICKTLYPHRTWIIPNTVTDLHLAQNSPSFRTSILGGRRLLSVYVANFCERKDQLRAVRIFANSGLRNSVLVLVGSEANEYSHVVSAWIRHHQPQLDLRGQQILVQTGLSRKRTMEITASSDIVLLSAKSETQPLVLIEAMALRKPWIAMNSGCIQTMQGGLVCRTESDFTRALTKLGSSTRRRQQLGSEGYRHFVSTHAPEIFSFHWQTLVNNMFNGKNY